jgi:hypothetical protein
MKRIAILLLAALLLAACQPTPEQEYIVNKGDDTLTVKLDATDAPREVANEVKLFPDRWEEEETEVQSGVFIGVNAEIVQKTDGRYPVFRTQSAAFTTDTVIEKLNTLLPAKPVATYDFEYTKEYWKTSLKEYLDWAEERKQWLVDGIPDLGDYDYVIDDDETIAKQTAWYMDAIQDAPDELEERPVSDYSELGMGKRTCYRLENGETVMVLCGPDYWVVQRKNEGGNVFRVLCSYEVEQAKEEREPVVNAWVEPTMPREDAEAILRREMERLGFTDFVLDAAFPADYIRRNEVSVEDLTFFCVSTGWSFRLRRDFGGYPAYNAQMLPSQYLSYEQAGDAIYNAPIPDEYIDVFIDVDGLQSFVYYAPKTVAGIVNPDVELLPFDTVKEQIKKTLAACLAGDPYNLGGHYEIYRLLLSTYTIREKDGDGFLEMPCWYVFFDWPLAEESAREKRRADLSGTLQQCMILNAVDGSIINPEYGY